MNPTVLRTINEHLDVAFQYLDQGNYERLSIQANRMITEATVFGDRPVLVLAGLVLRQAASLVQQTVPPDQLMDYPQKGATTLLLKDLALFLKDDSPSPVAPWEAAARFHQAFWADLRPKLEGKSYSDNPEFVDEMLRWGLQTIRQSWKLLANPTGSPFQGVVNEISRATKAHGASALQLAVFGLIQSLTWYSEYAIWQARKTDGSVDGEKLVSVLSPFVEAALDALGPPSGDEMFTRVADTAFNVLRAWRTDFAVYYDLFLQQQLEGRQRMIVPVARKSERRHPKRAAKKRGETENGG